MNCNLIVEINEITVRNYSLIEEEGLISHIGSRPGISFEYEKDEETAGRVLVIKGESLDALLEFLSFTELKVKIIN